MSHLQRRRTDAATLRRMFNDGRYWERVQSDDLVPLVEANRHPAPPPVEEPVCTRSQTVHYYTHDAVKVAVVHQYLRPDGTLGASGRPDPKALFVNDVLYSLA